MKNIVLVLIAIVVIIGAWLLLRKPAYTTPLTSTSTPVSTNTPSDSINNGSSSATSTDSDSTAGGMISIATPKVNSSVSSPISLAGQAKGGWYFEASAPVKVINKSGQTLGEGHIQATGDWMTPEFVPFTGSVSYTLPSGATSTEGFVVFMNDNPSGDPARELTVRVPVVLR